MLVFNRIQINSKLFKNINIDVNNILLIIIRSAKCGQQNECERRPTKAERTKHLK